MKVLLVDDHPLIWNGIRRALEAMVDADPVLAPLDFMAVRTAEEALSMSGTPFGLILLDYNLPGHAGLAALAAIREAFSESRVCVVSGTQDRQVVRAVLENDADGFIPKSYSDVELCNALQLIAKHRVYAPVEFLLGERAKGPEVAASRQSRESLAADLSPRQRETLDLLMQGLSNQAIANRMSITIGTVKSHLYSVFKLLGVNTRVEALCLLMQMNSPTGS
jgi:DNA-binding NarL/FixJ family response regulator